MSFSELGKNVGVAAVAGYVKKLRVVDASDVPITDWENAAQDVAVTWGSPSGGEVTPGEIPEYQIKAGKVVAAVLYLGNDNAEYARTVIPVESRESFANNGLFRATMAKLKIIDPPE